MNENDRAELATLRALSSSEAADYLLQKYPRGGTALVLLPHLSWKVSDQRRLASAYLANLPHANPRAYEAFASFMPLKNFIEAIKEHLPGRQTDRTGLLSYYLVPILHDQAKNDDDKQLVRSFVTELEALERAT